MTRDPNPLNVALDLTAEVERLRALLVLEDARKTLMGTRIEQIQAIIAGACGDESASGFDVLDGSIEAIVAERDEARAQAVRLAEALKLVARNAFQNIATVQWEHLEDRPDYERVADDICSKLAFDIDYINTALASTDARAWMREQKAAELERLKATDLRGTVEVYAKNGYPYDEDVIYVSAIDARIAELRRKEGA